MTFVLTKTLCGAAIAVFSAGAGFAVLAAADPQASVIDTFVAAPHQPGPAWWRISSPTSTVYVLGAPGALPKGTTWDPAVAARRLKGANEIILPPTLSADAGDTVAVIGILSRLHTSTPMEDSLPAPLKARFDADRAKMNGDPRAYSHWQPAVAALQMVSDYRRKNGLDSAEPAKTLRRMATIEGVHAAPAATYKAVPLFKALETEAGAVGSICLTDALDEIEAGPGPAHAAAEGWARGDVHAALSEQRGYEKCANSFPDGATLTRQAMHDTAGAIAQALAKPGHSVAVVNLRSLLAPGGVLQQLQARGFKIAKPDEIAD